jgi:hypothetical protein
METTRHTISKSAKKKMTSIVERFIEEDGKFKAVKVVRNRANGFTEQVVYKTKLPNGKYISKTRHEKIS